MRPEYRNWVQYGHAEDYMIYPQNIGKCLSIDEVSLSDGELYTILTNKEGRGKKKTMVACVRSIKADEIIKVLRMIDSDCREQVTEITMDMAKTMESVAKAVFPMARRVVDRFHCVQLVIEALQQVRIQHRWKHMKRENLQIIRARKKGHTFCSKVLSNGDTIRQLLARGRYLLHKFPEKWTPEQSARATLLFKHFPDIKEAYEHTNQFRIIFELKMKQDAKLEFDKWIVDSKTIQNECFQTAAQSIQINLKSILNFFELRSTNANAESFNSKIKLFRANLRGVKDRTFFLYRLQQLFA